MTESLKEYIKKYNFFDLILNWTPISGVTPTYNYSSTNWPIPLWLYQCIEE